MINFRFDVIAWERSDNTIREIWPRRFKLTARRQRNAVEEWYNTIGAPDKVDVRIHRHGIYPMAETDSL